MVFRVALLALVVSGFVVGSAQARDISGSAGKIDSGLRTLAAREDTATQITAGATSLVLSPGRRVQADVYVTSTTAAALAALRTAGMTVSARSDAGPVPILEGWVPIDALERIAALPSVRAIVPIGPSHADVGNATSQGVAAHQIPAIAPGITGAGIKVGIISDTINQVSPGISGSQGSGDLPFAINVINDFTPFTPTDEGRAMAEIVYDEAPGITQLSFAGGTAGAAGKANAINALVADGARIIVDDIYNLTEPFFQDGLVSQTVDAAARAGVLYLAATGNRARRSYEANTRFPDGVGPTVLHDFDPGDGVDTIETLGTIDSGRSVEVALQWDEPWGQAMTDLDIDLVTPSGTALPGTVVGGHNSNLVTHLPYEDVTWTNFGGDQPVAIRITRSAGTRSPVIKTIVASSTNSPITPQFGTGSDAINPDAASANGALAVAAVDALSVGHDTPKNYSSRGPKLRLFDVNGNRLATPEVRQKPDVAAADCVATTVAAFSTFCGTSAAAPAAAGIAALAWSAKPTLPLAVLRAILTNPPSAIDCTSAAGQPDTDCGVGFLLAPPIITQVLDSTPPIVSGVLAPATPNGQNGWWTGEVSVNWARSDPESPVVVTGGCPAVVPGDGEQTLTCQGTSAGGSSSANVVVRRDSTPPASISISGISARRYALGAVPRTTLRCTAKDATSGLASCAASAIDRHSGAHQVVATATDKAGLVATSALAYTVENLAGTVALKTAKAGCYPRGGSVKAAARSFPQGLVSLRISSSGRATKSLKRSGSISYRGLTGKSIKVKVSARLTGGKTSTVTRTVKRCAPKKKTKS